MKRIFIALVASLSALLAGCNFDSSECMKNVAEANRMTMEALQKQAEVMLTALNGQDPKAQGMALAWFMQADRKAQMMGYGECNRDTALAWASVLVPGATNVIGILQNAKTARHSSDNAVSMQQVNMGTVRDVALGGIEAASKPPLIVTPVAEPDPVTP